MPTLESTTFVGRVEWLGKSDAATETLCSEALDRMDLGFHGLAGARHEGENRASCVRVSNLYAEGTEIRNVRQLTILSGEELDAIASDMGLEALEPELAGANIVVRGIPDFTHVPPNARLQGPDGLTLTVDLENLPCVYPAREMEAEHPGHGKSFLTVAKGRRGVTAWVEHPGTLQIGDTLKLFIPAQRPWAP